MTVESSLFKLRRILRRVRLDVCTGLLVLVQVLARLFGLDDLFVFAGIGMLGYGVAQISPPAAWCVCGLIIFWLGVRH